MFERRSLRFPITLGVTLILIIVALTVGWVLLSISGATNRQPQYYWAWLSVGSLLFLVVLIGVVMYLSLSIKAINLTRRQSNFIDSVTHELKSPIASLKLYLQTMSLRDVDLEQRNKFQQFMMADIERLDGLISHLLDAGNIERKHIGEETETIDLGELLVGCAATVSARYRIDESVIECDLSDCRIKADRVDAVMIFRNVIDNAVKYAGSPPRVQVASRVVGEHVVVEISDNGEGIPKGFRQKVFGRFFRLGAELQRKKPGTGLGLYIVRTLVKRLGGKVVVLDRDKRLGTVFEVRLPNAEAHHSTKKVKSSETLSETSPVSKE